MMENNRIASLIEKRYQLWKQNPDCLNLDRKDLEEYVLSTYLKEVINKQSTN